MMASERGSSSGTPAPADFNNNNNNNDDSIALSADNGAAIVRNIASFLTLSDATSMVSIGLPGSSDPEHYTATPPGYAAAAVAAAAAAASSSSGCADADSWAVGEELHLEQLDTPATPALMAISPGATPRFDLTAYHDHHNRNHHKNSSSHHHAAVDCDADAAAGGAKYDDDDDEDDDDYICDEYELEELLQDRKRRWAQERLAAAVFAHPRSIRSYCVEAYSAASEIRQQKEAQKPAALTTASSDGDPNPETHRDPPCGSGATTTTSTARTQQQQLRPYNRHHHHRLGHRRRRKDFVFIHDIVDSVLHNVPLSVLLDFSTCAVEVYLESVSCTVRISVNSVKSLVQALSQAILLVWDGITNLNPFAVLDAIISLQVNAMGKTSEVLASGIQSVATGVGSASSIALHRLSRSGVGNLSVNRTGSNSSSMGANGLLYHGQQRRSSSSQLLQKKLLRKVSTINSAAEVISYRELEDDTGGLSRHAKSRVQRMMHYDVSLRPFVATIAMPPNKSKSNAAINNGNNFDNVEFAGQPDRTQTRTSSSDADENRDQQEYRRSSSSSSDSSSPMDSPFMCTPQSFPPTPASRTTVLARSTRFADDVVFLARDKIRVHDALASDNERTREMARALSEGKRLAVFDAKDAGSSGIELTCGQHLATKVGNMLYCSTRSMVPILRNCSVYFEMTVMPRPVGGNFVLQASSMVTLSIGLSTEEMPNNTLVGAWSGSVGLCTTGQILTAGQWCSPGDPSLSSYGDMATVGCLVCLDDGSAFETWDGVMITAQVTFNVNGRVVSPPVSTLPTTGGPSRLLPGAQMQVGLMNGSIGYDQLQYRGHNPPVPNWTLPLLVPAAEELYPTVTLHSPASAVMCRFSAEDIVASSPESIGAPEGRTIYAVDGSVINFPPKT